MRPLITIEGVDNRGLHVSTTCFDLEAVGHCLREMRTTGFHFTDVEVHNEVEAEIQTLTTTLDNALAEVQRLNGLIIHLEATIKADNAQVTEDYEAGSSAMKAAASEIERLKSESAERISLITDLAAYIQTTCPNGSWWVASLADRVDEMENEAYGDGNSQIEAKP